MKGYCSFGFSSEDQMYGMSEKFKGKQYKLKACLYKRANYRFITQRYSSAFESH